MRTNATVWKCLSIATLMFGLLAGALAGSASAETIALSTPTMDSSSFVPGENVTVTYSGMTASTGYDFTVTSPNGTIVMRWENQSSSGTTFMFTITIPSDWDGTYTVHGYLNSTGTARGTPRSFTVMLFRLNASADRNVYLPGDTVTVFYYTQRLDDQKALASGNGHWRMAVQRDNGTGTITDNLGGPFTSPQGTFTVVLPATTVPNYYYLYATYNDSTDMHSQTSLVYVYVSNFNVGVTLDRSTYSAGDNIVVRVSATASSTGIGGVAVTTKVETHDIANATWVTETSYTVDPQTTGQDGTVSYLVALHAGISDGTEMRVTVSASKGGTPQEASRSFTVRAVTGLSIDLSLDKTTYKPGDAMVATLKFVSTNATLVGGAMYLWEFTDSATGATLLQDYNAGGATGASKTYNIPASFTGTIDVQVTVYTPDDRTYYRSDSAGVFKAALLITPSKSTYSGGDTITVKALLVSDTITGTPTFIWTVTPSSGGDPIAKGSSTPGGKEASFPVTIPTPADDQYTIDVSAAASGSVVRDTATINLEKYVAMQIKVPDKSFKPGDTVTIHYKFVAVGGATLPRTATITVYMYGGFGSTPSGGSAGQMSFDVAAPASGAFEGDVNYTIPSSAPPDADVMLFISSGSYGSSFNPIYMRSSGGAAPASAAASTATWGLVIAVLALFVAVLAMMRKPRNPRDMSESYTRSSSFSDLKPETPKKDEMKKDDSKKDEPPKSL